jgi:DeoR family transcriptional regulator, catabolite repression regulator
MTNKKKKIFLVKDLMIKIDKFPVVKEMTLLKDTLEEMSNFKIGIACIVKNNKFIGVFTDGDLRRKILKEQKPFSAFFNDDIKIHLISKPFFIKGNIKIDKALQIMEKKKIWDLPVVDNKMNLIGLLHLHPALKTILSK